MKTLFIVESQAKIAKISSFLGKNYLIKASAGHVQDLDEKTMSIDFDNHFEPIYVVTKPDIVNNLKLIAKHVNMVYLASDEDREGEAIAQSLYDLLQPVHYKRLRFNEITKTAILAAIENAGTIEVDLVDAQKARRVLDRLYGYLISPLLQRKIGGHLSAGRTQSPTVRLVIDRENEIRDFLLKNQDSSHFKVTGLFNNLKANLFELTDKVDMNDVFKGRASHIPLIDNANPNAKVIVFLKRCLKSVFRVHAVNDKMTYRNPAPPFMTSSLQQEAYNKLGMSIDATMKTAQKLYEGGYITYMRTDSLTISAEGQVAIKKVIETEYGKEYYQKNVYKNKSTSAQESHEAIRPTHPDLLSLEKEVDEPYQIKLYKLIWQRTIASQMKPAQINVTTIQISISKFIDEQLTPFYYFQSAVDKVIFPGFMKVYVPTVENEDEEIRSYEGRIPKRGAVLTMDEIVARQEFNKPPLRYTEASLVKKLKELEIGRPATYVKIIKTIKDREYVKIGNAPGIERDIVTYSIKSEDKIPIKMIYEESGKIFLGQEKNKLMPTELGITVNDFLMENFAEMMNYQFTAQVEAELDDIANKEKVWYQVVQQFYDRLKPIVDEVAKKTVKPTDKLLGHDKDGEEIFVTRTKFGPVVKKKLGDKFVFAKIKAPLTLETITLEAAINLLKYPKLVGEYNGADVLLQTGPYGYYLIYQKEFYSLPADVKEDIDIDAAIKVISSKKSAQLAEFNVVENGKKVKVVVMNGQYGLYLQVKRGAKKTNYKLPADVKVDELTEEKILEIISVKKTFRKN